MEASKTGLIYRGLVPGMCKIGLISSDIDLLEYGRPVFQVVFILSGFQLNSVVWVRLHWPALIHFHNAVQPVLLLYSNSRLL